MSKPRSINKNKVEKKTKTRSKRAPKPQSKRSKTKNKCPPNMTPIKVKGQLICVGRCPHSGGPIYYNPKLDKLICKWHGSQFSLSGKVETPPANSNLNVKQI